MTEYRCPTCRGSASIRPRSWIGHDSGGNVLACDNYPDCDTYVGVHRYTLRPMGRMATREVRWKRSVAHTWIDQMWQDYGYSRQQAYEWVAETLGLTDREAHVAKLSEGQLDTLIEAARAVVRKLAREAGDA